MTETQEEANRRRREASDAPRRSEPEENPLFTLIKALLAFFIRALQPDKDAPDFEDAEPQKRQQVRIEYEQSRLKIEQSLPRYSESIPDNRGAQINSAQYAARLMKMRQEVEASNGGAKVQAIIPVEGDGRVTSDVGHRHEPMKGASSNHGGLDLASPTPGQKVNIRSAMPGIVVGAGWREGYGNTVDVMDVYGKTHRYAHLDSYNVKPGDDIAQGAKLGVMGMTGRSKGVHLHYEQRDQSGNKINPILIGRTWVEGERFTGKQSDAFLAAQSRQDNATVVASAPQVPAAAAASVAQAGIKTGSSIVVTDDHDHSHAPVGAKPSRSRS